MRYRLPILNAINFGIIFGILTYYLNQIPTEINILFLSNPYLNGLVWLGIGFLVAWVTLILFTKTNPHNMPKQVSTKLVVIPTILLAVLIVLSVFFLAGINPFKIEGHSTAETLITEETNESENSTVEQEIEESPEIDSKYSGRCEERTGYEKVYVPEAGDYTHEPIWEKLDYGCNIKRDCLEQLQSVGKTYEDTGDVRCNV